MPVGVACSGGHEAIDPGEVLEVANNDAFWSLFDMQNNKNMATENARPLTMENFTQPG